MTDRTYREQVDPITSDKRDRIIPASNLRKKVLALDVARNAEHLVLHGDFLFADRNSTGQVDVQLNSTAEDAWPLTAQDGVRDMPIRDVFITHAAQAGKVLNLWYGYRARFLAGANSIASIGSILNAVTLAPWVGKNRLYSPGFIGDRQTAAPGAGLNALMQLFNPAGSGITGYVDRVHVDPPAAAVTSFVLYNASALIGVTSLNGVNKRLGSPASLCVTRGGSASTGFGSRMDTKQLNATGMGEEWVFEEPVILPEGKGLTVVNVTQNQAANCAFEWREGA